MEQRIGFCTSADGTCIAHATIEAGPVPVVYVAGFPSHLEAEWSRPSARRFLEQLADGATLVRYDLRGSGLSDREVNDVSIAAHVSDLSAVIAACGFERFALLGLGMLAAPVAITYAAAHPHAVTRLVLSSAYANGARLLSPDKQASLIDQTERMGLPVLEYAEPSDPDAMLDRTGRDILHLASTPHMQAALLRVFFKADVTHLLGNVTAPATILHGRDDRIVPFAEGRALAANLPRAEFIPIDGNTGAALTEGELTMPAIRKALGIALTSAAPSAGGILTVLFTDVVSHTEIMHRLGDERGRDVLREHDRTARETLRGHGGTEVKTMGDGFMASFGSVTGALDCAVALQHAFLDHEALAIRVGLNAGEPIAEDGDLFGSTVILASRICAQAGAGEILIPEPIRHLLAGKSYTYADRGEFVPKGFDDAVRLFEVKWA